MNPTPTSQQQTHLNTFYSILGKLLGLSIVGASAYQQSQTGGASSLLQPANLAALIQETEGIILTPSPLTQPNVQGNIAAIAGLAADPQSKTQA